MNSRKRNYCTQLAYTAYSWVPRFYPESWNRRFESAAYLPGNFLIGKAGSIVSFDGRGLDRVIAEEAKTRAFATDSGRCYWYLGTHNITMLVTSYEDIVKITEKNNWQNIHLEDATGSFKLVFGNKTTFAAIYGSALHTQRRKKYVKFFFDPNQLRTDTQPILKFAQDEMAEIKRKEIIGVADFSSSSTMKTLGKLKLGFQKFGVDEKDEKKPSVDSQITAIVNDISVEVASAKMQLAQKFFPACIYNKIYKNSKIASLLQKGEKIIHDELIEPNKEYILSTNNWLNADSKEQVDLDSDDVLNDIKEIFVAGHDTTKVLLRACIMLLADSQHLEEVEKLRKDLMRLPDDTREWTYDDIKKIERLDWIVNEALRLYPPVPDMNVGISQPIKYGDGTLYPGDTVFFSPRITLRSPKIWGNDAHHFRPERFKDSDLSKMLFNFGFDPRSCPGQNFAKLKVKITIAQMVMNFDFAFVNPDYHHPFDYYQMFTLRFTESEVPIRFKPLAATSAADVKSEDRRPFGLCYKKRGGPYLNG